MIVILAWIIHCSAGYRCDFLTPPFNIHSRPSQCTEELHLCGTRLRVSSLGYGHGVPSSEPHVLMGSLISHWWASESRRVVFEGHMTVTHLYVL